MHASHVTRFSDSSLYDSVCTNCGVTDAQPERRLVCASEPEHHKRQRVCGLVDRLRYVDQRQHGNLLLKEAQELSTEVMRKLPEIVRELDVLADARMRGVVP